MLYRIAHILRDKFPWIWESIGVINSFLFALRYGKRMKKITGILKSFSLSSNQTSEETSKSSLFNIEALTKENVSLLSRMFAEQPASAFDLFKPHGFGDRSLSKCATEISSFLGLHVYGTIAPENIASMKSAQAANDVKIIETLRNGDYLVEYLPKS